MTGKQERESSHDVPFANFQAGRQDSSEQMYSELKMVCRIKKNPR